MLDTDSPESCDLCRAGNRADIDGAIRKGLTTVQVSSRFGVAVDEVRRHRGHLYIRPDPPRALMSGRASKQEHHPRRGTSPIRQLLRKYGITRAEFDALVLRSEGRCEICTEPSTVLVIDHCHATGQVRGLLCGPCNSMLGMAQDRIEVLIDAAVYLRSRAVVKDLAG